MGEGPASKMGWNWLWFTPACAGVLFFVEGHTASHAFQLLRLAYQRWSWGALISPSAYFCLTVILVSVAVPIQGLAYVRALTTGMDTRKRNLYVALIIVTIFLLPLLTDALTWGSFPFNFDNRGLGRLRMIPFIPWPDGPFGQY